MDRKNTIRSILFLLKTSYSSCSANFCQLPVSIPTKREGMQVQGLSWPLNSPARYLAFAASLKGRPEFSDKSNFSGSLGLSSNYASTLWPCHTALCAHPPASVRTHVHTYPFFQRMQWVKYPHGIFKTTAKVIPGMASPTKPAFSRNVAKQKYIFFHCFPRHFPILDAGFHKASQILTFFFFLQYLESTITPK